MSNAIHSPAHYVQAGTPLEPIDVIESAPFSLGNVIKYLCRAGHKDDELQDLKKAKYYIKRAALSNMFDPEPYEYFLKARGSLLRKLAPFADLECNASWFLIDELESLINKKIRAIERKQTEKCNEAK